MIFFEEKENETWRTGCRSKRKILFISIHKLVSRVLVCYIQHMVKLAMYIIPICFSSYSYVFLLPKLTRCVEWSSPGPDQLTSVEPELKKISWPLGFWLF
jgi:hypothetical protein